MKYESRNDAEDHAHDGRSGLGEVHQLAQENSRTGQCVGADDRQYTGRSGTGTTDAPGSSGNDGESRRINGGAELAARRWQRPTTEYANAGATHGGPATASLIPPWVNDPEPECWVTFEIAARHYFRRSQSSLRRWQHDGRFKKIGIPVWRDDVSWYCRLPVRLTPRKSN